jgi:lysozyme family protein
MDDFTDAFTQTLNFEGGVDQSMPNRPSNRGITQELYTAYNKKMGKEVKDVKAISYGEAKDIGMDEFWKPMGLDKFPSSAVKAVLFDDGFNSGGGTAIKSLQQIVGTKADGLVGKNTMKAYKKYVEKNGETALINSLLNDREQRYFNLATQKPREHQQHINGWINRVNTLRAKYLVP